MYVYRVDSGRDIAKCLLKEVVSGIDSTGYDRITLPETQPHHGVSADDSE